MACGTTQPLIPPTVCSMENFATDFQVELEAHCVKSAPAHPTQKTWNPLGVAAPERHLRCAEPLGLPFEAAVYQLSRNEAFQQLNSMFHFEFDAASLRDCVGSCEDAEIAKEKEQVWLFGYRWFSIYYEELLNIATVRSEFYRKRHTEFMDLLRKACDPIPARRPTFYQLLEIWDPVITTPSQSVDAVASSAAAPAPCVHPPAYPVASSAVGVSSHRLVLNGQVRRVARNKTRRNQCN